MGHIFISYSHTDTEYAHALAANLHEMGFDVWIDERLDYGSQWPQELQRQLDSCSAFILIMSPRSYSSEWVQSELQRARRKTKPIFPLLLEGDEAWLSVESTQYYDVRGGHLPDARFYAALKKVMSATPTASTLNFSKRPAPAKTVPQTAQKSSAGIILAVLGLVAVFGLACGVILIAGRFVFFKPQSPSISVTTPADVTPTARPTRTPELTATLTSIPPSSTSVPPTETPAIGAPVIDSVELREDTSTGDLIIYQDISFHDAEGDVYYIDFVLVSDLSDVETRDGPITSSSEEQKSGAVLTGTWLCGDGDYQVTLQATILDRAGNRSNTIEYTMFCHN